MPAALYDDPLLRIVLTGGAIRRGPQALQKHLSALGDMMERVLASIDPEIPQQAPGPQLSSAYRRRLKQAASQFPRSVAEFFCAFSYADISAAKGNTFLAMAVNPKFSPHDLSEFTSVQSMESKIMKFLFPEGHKTANLTRQRDGRPVILHYVPFIEVGGCFETKALKAKCITTLRCSGQPGALEYVQSGAATRGHYFKGHK